MMVWCSWFCTILSLFLTVSQAQTWILWPNTPPKSIPFEKSTDILDWEYFNNTNIAYGGKYTSADTWYPSAITNNNGLKVIYTPFTDGIIYFNDGSSITSTSYGGGMTTTGYTTLIGQNVTDLVLMKNGSGTISSSAYPYEGRYPCTNTFYNNTWFYGTYAVNAANDNCIWYYMCAFVGFRWSKNNGMNWTEPRVKMNNQSDNIFGESCIIDNKYNPIKFGSPHVVDFGENLKYSPDNKLYIIGHGSNINNSIVSWIQGDQIYLAKVNPTIENINTTNSWLFYNGNNNWTNNNGVSDAMPLFTWINKTGCVTMTYFNVLNKYIMTITTPTNPPNTTEPFDTYFLESDNINGPFKYITYLSQFGPQAYFVNYPSEFLANSINYVDNNAYYEGYLSYSNDWRINGTFGGNINQTKPYGGGYHWSLQKARFKLSKQFTEKLNKENVSVL